MYDGKTQSRKKREGRKYISRNESQTERIIYRLKNDLIYLFEIEWKICDLSQSVYEMIT